MWRELLIAAVVRGGTSSPAVKEIKSSIEQLKLTSKVSDLIRCKGGESTAQVLYYPLIICRSGALRG